MRADVADSPEPACPMPEYRCPLVGVEPPSMRKVVPVMKSVSGLARKQTAAAISIGCPSLLTVWCTMFLRTYCLPNSGSSLPCLCAVSMKNLSSCGV